MRSIFLSCIFLISVQLVGFSQSIIPYTLNMGGGYSAYLEWSIGESVSVSNFIRPGLELNTGVLQPTANLITAISDFPGQYFSNQIRIGPNPFLSVLYLDIELKESGSISYDLLDLAGIERMHFEAGFVFGNYSQKIDLEKIPSGTYFIRLLFRPNNREPQTAIFKLIKL
ncbi:MAG: Secretion system C-terminal sorting domain [Bacteroidota bacterium]